MILLVKFPSRERPQRFKTVLRKWVDMAANPSDIHWVFSFDSNDRSMAQMQPWIQSLGISATVVYGVSNSKIHAINRDINELTIPWDTILVLSDDMVCVRQGWDELIRQDMDLYYPDGDGCIWCFDGKQMDICTIPLMGRKYYDAFGYVYRPEYTSVFADDDQTAVAKQAGKMIFFEDMIARHEHPANGYGKPDALYRKNETSVIWAKDEAIYKSRKAQGFPK